MFLHLNIEHVELSCSEYCVVDTEFFLYPLQLAITRATAKNISIMAPHPSFYSQSFFLLLTMMFVNF
jgi:hypothetical protein